MKLIFAIVNNDDSHSVSSSLTQNGFQAIQAALSDFLMQLPAVLSRKCRYLH